MFRFFLLNKCCCHCCCCCCKNPWTVWFLRLAYWSFSYIYSNYPLLLTQSGLTDLGCSKDRGKAMNLAVRRQHHRWLLSNQAKAAHTLHHWTCYVTDGTEFWHIREVCVTHTQIGPDCWQAALRQLSIPVSPVPRDLSFQTSLLIHCCPLYQVNRILTV